MTYIYKAEKSTVEPKINNEQCLALVRHFKDANVAMLLLVMHQSVPDDVEFFKIDKQSVADGYGISINRQDNIYQILRRSLLLRKQGHSYCINKEQLFYLLNK